MVFSVLGEPFTELKKTEKMKNKFFYFLILLLIFSCKKDPKQEESYFKGEMTILTDESFQSVTEALAEGYMINYPEANIKVKTQKEDLAFLDFLKKKSKVVVLSRELSEKEKNEFEKVIDLEYEPAKFAADAVVFVVPKNSEKESISMDEIKSELNSDEKNFIFDGTNSSNLNFVAQKLNKKPSELKFSIINGNKNVIEQLHKHPNKIGVIGLNTISRPYSKEAEELRSLIKILPIIENGKTFEPNFDHLRNMTYPFTRVLYFLTNEGGFGMAGGFIRFSCTHLGQMIVQKEGLQKYNQYKREVQMR